MQKNVRSILVVDDDQDDIMMLEEALLTIDSSLSISAASSGKQAIHFLKNNITSGLPSLLVLDYNMPDMTGAQVLQAIGKEDWFSSIIKAIWSTSNAELYEQICQQFGANYYFKKPDNIDDIWLLAKTLLEL